ncbi:alpha/beta fold hydrolase [Breoghania sp. L-A4]|uniref:PHA/PHB synthase family protein n=1 Tax=Breoghania sp. L-A4 TaxID=2304600 RepID=UPI000E35D6F6|nr:alpha/beta fold hydrolase [Breoghania sp. L-A4]AXS42025.1 alpha/beta fold hydrolase [Breoghania sp. L-A4]
MVSKTELIETPARAAELYPFPIGAGRAVAPQPPLDEADSYSARAFAEVADRAFRAGIARATLGISPSSLAQAYFDWFSHIAASPGKQMRLAEKALRKSVRMSQFAATCLSGSSSARCIEPLPQDKRFSDPAWDRFPFNLIHQSFLLNQQWWHNAVTGVRGVSVHHEKVVEFVTRQILDVFSPSNSLLTNPEVLERTRAEGGRNLVRGYENLIDDWERWLGNKPPVGTEDFQVGETLAVTPGKVVYRNDLIELIQYTPTTKTVAREPVLIVPAWIMKYYILDLSPENSMVRYLVEQGHTVFMVSWKNPGPSERDFGLEAYRRLGVMAALEVVGAIVPDAKVHAVGYCLGGTLLAIAAAAMARFGDDRLATVSLFAAQTDFTEAGELTLFIDESQVSFLEDMMWEQGFLDTKQMAGAFQLLRSNDLIWSRSIREYLMGERPAMFDLMAWNADATRMPYRMHSEYLRQLFLDNDFAAGRYHVGAEPVVVEDISAPFFVVGTESDHVAPWRSVHKITHLADSELTFVLTTGGHNAGIVSEPGHKHRSYKIMTQPAHDGFLDPEGWSEAAEQREGSWWEAWAAWLTEHSSAQVPPPETGRADAGYPPLMDAPGSYVLMK